MTRDHLVIPALCIGYLALVGGIAIGLIPWYVVYALAGVGVYLRYRLSFTNREQQRRHEAGLCMECGYDLRASSEVCPECGFDRNDP